MSFSPALSRQTAETFLKERRGPGRLTGGHKVYIYALTGPQNCLALLAENGGHMTGGFGKWEQISVPRGIPFTQWVGRDLFAMDLELLLDNWAKHKSVEPGIKALEEMALRPGNWKGQYKTQTKPYPTPPPIRLVGAIPHPEFTWVINGIDWGDCLRHPKTGQRLRQAVTLHMLEYVEETEIANTLAPKKPAPRKYKVKKGDNLKKLAAHFLHKASRWKEIEKLNKGMRGWKLPPKWVGKTIKIPAH